MSVALQADSRTGEVHGPLAQLRALLEDESHGEVPANAPTGIRRALEAARRAACRLSLARGAREAQCWIDAEAAALLVDDGDAQGRLLGLAAGVATSAIADLCELGPRPHPAAGTSYLAVPALARALADPHRTGWSSPGQGSEADPAFAAALGGLRAHWRVTSEWLQAATAQTHVLEVIDTEAGLWTVHPLGDRVRVEPSTPAAAWRALNALVPRRGDRQAEAAPGRG
jgi:hypothetical protein